MNILRTLGVLAALLLAPVAASAQIVDLEGNCATVDAAAGPGGSIYDSECAALDLNGVADDTQGYIGLTWKLGEKLDAPLFSVGVRSIKGDGADRLEGADLRASFDVKRGFAFDSVKLGYLAGKPRATLNIGGGYSFANKEVLASAALSRGPLEIGVDFGLKSRDWTPFLSLTSLAEPEAGKGCAKGYSQATLSAGSSAGLVVFSPEPLDIGAPGDSFCVIQGEEVFLN